MSTPKLSPKFPMSVKPVNPGVYKVIRKKFPRVRYSEWWNGRWGAVCVLPKNANSFRRTPSEMIRCGVYTHWQGLAEKSQ